MRVIHPYSLCDCGNIAGDVLKLTDIFGLSCKLVFCFKGLPLPKLVSKRADKAPGAEV